MEPKSDIPGRGGAAVSPISENSFVVIGGASRTEHFNDVYEISIKEAKVD